MLNSHDKFQIKRKKRKKKRKTKRDILHLNRLFFMNTEADISLLQYVLFCCKTIHEGRFTSVVKLHKFI